MEGAPNYEPPWTLVTNKRKTRRTKQLASRLAANQKFMNRVMKTVKIMNKKVHVSEFNKAESEKFINEMKTIPVYVIRAHSCLMNPKKAEKIKAKQVIEVPKDTYIVTFGSPGDYMCTSNNRLVNLKARLADLRKYMYLHSQSDVRQTKKSTYSLFSDMKRIAQYKEGSEKVMFPNISYTMNNIDTARMTRTAVKENDYGVYRIDNVQISKIAEFKNKDSLVSQNIDKDDWNLDDIIEEVYQKTGIRKGIFISLGCLSACGDSGGAPDFLMKLAYIYEEANALYNTVRPTMTRDEVLQFFGDEALAKNISTKEPIPRWVPGMYERMVKEGLIDPEEWPDMLEHVAEEDWPVLYRMAGLN
jgi:hypothetical protein